MRFLAFMRCCLSFINLNGTCFEIRKEKPRREVAKFKYHIPYLIFDAYRVELTNYHSDFTKKEFKWDVEIHYSQGKEKAKIYRPVIKDCDLPDIYHANIQRFLTEVRPMVPEKNLFQQVYCMTTDDRKKTQWLGPYELLNQVRSFIDQYFPPDEQKRIINLHEEPNHLPLAISIGYYILSNIFN